MGPSTAGELTRAWQPDWPCAAGQVLRPQRRGAGDPTHRVDDVRTDTGAPPVRRWAPATLCVQPRPREGDVLGRAWGPGAEWVLEAMPATARAPTTIPSGFVPDHHPAVAEGWRRHRHWRLGRTGRVMEALVPSILEQKVTGKQAFGSFRELVRAPRRARARPGGRRCGCACSRARPRSPPSRRGSGSSSGVEPGPVAHPRHRLPASPTPSSGPRGVEPEEADRRLRSIRGVGVWTSAEVRQRALGDPDAVSFGDYHLANWVGWALFGHDITDEEMAEAARALPTPARPGRRDGDGRRSRHDRRRGPRMSIPTHLPTR